MHWKRWRTTGWREPDRRPARSPGPCRHRPDNTPEKLRRFCTVLIGLLAGLVANLLTPGTGHRDLLMTVALGIGGSLAAIGIGRFAGLYRAGQSAGCIGAVVGAVVVLLAYQLIAPKG